MKLLTLDDLPLEKQPEIDRRVLVRVDFNVPMKNGEVVDDYRIRQAVPTIQYLLDKKCIVILMAHFGRPLKEDESKREPFSLLPVGEKLASILNREVLFSEDTVGSAVEKLVYDARPGKTVILLENLRYSEGEEANDPAFAEKLFKVADFYVNDAFGACHRAHASIDAITQFTQKRAMGRLLEKEWKALNGVLHSPKTPQYAVLGGAKIADKIGVIKRLMDTCEKIFVGGRMGQTFLKAKGENLGGSSVEEEALPLARRLMAEAKTRHIQIVLPIDGMAASAIDSQEAKAFDVGKIPEDLSLFDIGPKTIAEWTKSLTKAKAVIWNGPLGVFENPAFSNGTLLMVDFLVKHRDSIQTVAGGGETVAAITRRNALDKLFHVSTGGGAMLEFLEGKKLPGFAALELREREIDQVLSTGFSSGA